MPATYKILIMGASYGSLLGTKLLAAGNTVKLICLPDEANLMNEEGARIRMPVKGRQGLVEIDTRKLPGKLSAGGAQSADPKDYDLVALAMQEPQYRSAGVRELLDAVAKAKVPCMSIMNMPPLPYLARIASIPLDACRAAYTDASVWDSFDPKYMTLCSPDPQAFRPPEDKVNVLQVRLPTNFKSARFESEEHTKILRDLEAGVEAARFDAGDGTKIELPVKFKVHDSVFVPLAKWSMLLAGNYRCVQKDGMRTIKDAVHSDVGDLALGLRLGRRALQEARRGRKRPRAFRQVRERRVVASEPFVGRACARQRRAEHRACGPARADHREIERHAERGSGQDRRARRRVGGEESEGGEVVGAPRLILSARRRREDDFRLPGVGKRSEAGEIVRES